MIRKMKPSDITRVAEIHVFARRSAYRDIVPDDYLFNANNVSKRMEELNETMHNSAEESYVFDDGIVKGFTSFGQCRDDGKSSAFELLALYVDPMMQRQGIGTALISFFEQNAVQHGFKEVCYWVFEKNASARALYEKLGYRPDGARDVAEPFDDLMVMRYAKKLI
ncbi:MAG: GNAT family N-acetyltransferase [Defluviitaleaceae bacterium]|nr:GNAT family N-acetyltransferase [Defluviitaleaceae bacterium]